MPETWQIIPCTEAHPGQTCAEYDRWLDQLEQEADDD